MGWGAAMYEYMESQAEQQAPAVTSTPYVPTYVRTKIQNFEQFHVFAREEPGAVIPTQGIKLFIKDQQVHFLDTNIFSYHYGYMIKNHGEKRYFVFVN